MLWFHSLLLVLHLLIPSMAAGMREDLAIYLVLVQGEPVAFHQPVRPLEGHRNISISELQAEHAKSLVEFHDQLLERTLDAGAYNKLHSFHHIANGFAVHTTKSQAEKLRLAPEVLHVEKDRGAKLMTTYTPNFLGLPEGAWTQVGGKDNAGEGVVIGVVDTGIDPTHPSFAYDPSSRHGGGNETDWFSRSACELGPRFRVGSCNGKIVSARYFFAGAAAALPLDTSKDLSPFDEIGHGSHVAAIAAGNWGVSVVVDGVSYGRASGMAPHARIAVYKAIYPEGGTLADVVSAIDQAAEDRVDVLVLSVGPDEPPEETQTFMNMFDILLLFARRAGIFVVQAAGNKGPGEGTVVCFSPWAMGAAASTTGRSYTADLVMGNGHQLQGVGLSAPTPGNGKFQFKLVSARDATIRGGNITIPPSTLYAEECQHPEELQAIEVRGRIVICSFSEGFFNGTSTITAILDTAKHLGFVGFVLVANPLYGDFVAHPLPLSIPGIMIPRVADAEVLWEYYNIHTYKNSEKTETKYGASAAIKEGRSATFNEPAPIVARYSSRGPDIIDSRMNPADVLKPDILAPGDQIWSAWSPVSALDPILSGNTFALLSGTSMAAPHVAGIAALVKQRRPSWTPSMIASAISTTATKHNDRGLPIMSYGTDLYTLTPSTPFDHGAGLVNPSGALEPGLVFSADFEDYISFLCSLPGVDPATVKSVTGRECNATLAFPTDLNLPSITITALHGFRSVRRTVKNVESEPEEYSCSVVPPEGVGVEVLPSWFSILPEGTQDLVIRLNVSNVSENFKFGEIVFTGSLDHIVRMPLSVLPKALG